MNAAFDTSALFADLDAKEIALIPRDRQERLAELLATIARRKSQRQFFDLFPDNDNTAPDGRIIYSRDRYPKHIEFFDAGATYRERCFLAANRVGKSTCGAYETTAHLTGLYPHWWKGRHFEAPVSAWACGKKFETVKDVNQHALLGEVTYDTPDGRKGFPGSAMIPAHLMGRITWKRGVDDLVDSILVKHVSGGWSRLAFKAYEQKRGAFEGTARHVIWLDEECPLDIYGECLIRTATTGGIVMLTFTPLDGLTETVMQFMPGMAE
jgi:phage terminase large subunit-like protein